MSGVTLTGIQKNYGEFAAVDALSLEIRDGELLALLGPSGCGKTTTLRMIAGFVTPSAGQIRFGPRDVTRVPVHKRNVGMVFQGYALFPHLTVAQNIEFGLRVRPVSKQQKAARVAEMLKWVQLEALAERHPKALSGGQQQRVALARAMAIQPEVLLLDEPFSALDAKLRTQMRTEIRELQRDAGITSVFVTHDQEEAMAIADRIAVMNNGKLEQLGSAQDLYQRPASRFVASFIGKCNLLPGQVTAPGRFEAAGGQVFGFSGERAKGPATLCFRPEKATLSAQPAASGNNLAVSLRGATYLGAVTEYEVIADSGERLLVSAASSASDIPATPGARLNLCWPAADCVLVD
jgi:putative spermidine/putrescine transport system ATP-binding protein